MVYIMLALISLSVFYLTRYFARKKMHAATVAIVALLCVVFAISCVMLVLKGIRQDFPKDEEIFLLLTENEPLRVLREGSGIVPNFTMYVLRTVVALITITLGSTGLVLLHGLFHITKDVVKHFIKSTKLNQHNKRIFKVRPIASFIIHKPALCIICRMNC